jgi:hypothetical protein
LDKVLSRGFPVVNDWVPRRPRQNGSRYTYCEAVVTCVTDSHRALTFKASAERSFRHVAQLKRGARLQIKGVWRLERRTGVV